MLQRALRSAILTMLGLIALPVLYAVTALVLGMTAVNADFQETEPAVTIYVRSNGVHTDIVVPVVSELHDWTAEFARPAEVATAPFITFGWGDRGFYVETPQWKDLRASVAFQAMSGLGRSAMRVDFAGQPEASRGDITLRLSKPRYLRLVASIRGTFARGPLDRPIPIAISRNTGNSTFYEAIGRYSLLRTCNVWVRNVLAAADVRMPVWSPFAGAIFYQLARIRRPSA